VPDPMNPQSLNRYSYCLNNPLRYVDPMGHWYDDDWYYELACAEAGVDPSVGQILVYDDGGWVSLGITVPEFVSWADSPEPFDFISRRKLPGFVETGLQGLGIEDAFYYQMSPTANPIPLYYYGDKGVASKLLGGVGGIGIYPLGAFANKLYLNDEPRIPAHEGKHYSEQRTWGLALWVMAYGVELAADWIYYDENDFWKGPHNVNSREVAAREWAGQSSNPYPIPAPRWQSLWK